MTRNWEGSTRRQRLPSGWHSTIVPRILARDQRICHWCGRPGADQVDHVRPGDDHRDENLAAIHAVPCHRRKSSMEGHAARNARRGAARHPAERHPGAV